MGARHREKDKPGADKTRKQERRTQICKPAYVAVLSSPSMVKTPYMKHKVPTIAGDISILV